MKKIPCIFQRTGHDITREVTPGCEWVFEGEGVATRKYDGTAVLVRDGKLYKRYECKNGKTPPEGWEPCQPEGDPITGHWPGWLLVTDAPEDWMHREVGKDGSLVNVPNGTYELCGTKIGKNPEGFNPLGEYVLIKHGELICHLPERTYEDMKKFLEVNVMEGIVFHHVDGRMAKIRRKDFGLKWPVT